MSSLSRFTTRRLVVIGVLIVIGLIIFFSVLDGVREQRDLARLDVPLFEWFLAHRSPGLTSVMQAITNVAAPLVLAMMVLVGALLWVWRKKDIWRPFLLISGMILAMIISAIIKTLVARARPPMTDMIPPLEVDFSLPSGHTIGIAVCLLILGYFVYSVRRTAAAFFISLLVVMIGISAVALSRLYLGYHWVTDVTASVGLALIILGIIITLDTFRPKKLLGPFKQLF